MRAVSVLWVVLTGVIAAVVGVAPHRGVATQSGRRAAPVLRAPLLWLRAVRIPFFLVPLPALPHRGFTAAAGVMGAEWARGWKHGIGHDAPARGPHAGMAQEGARRTGCHASSARVTRGVSPRTAH
jgi:hypothetical protein